MTSIVFVTFLFTTAETYATSLVHYRIDYCNSVYHELPLQQIKRLLQIQNTLARADTRTPEHSHITPVLKSLQWLKIEQRLRYKIISITHYLLLSSDSQYLRKLINVMV